MNRKLIRAMLVAGALALIPAPQAPQFLRGCGGHDCLVEPPSQLDGWTLWLQLFL